LGKSIPVLLTFVVSLAGTYDSHWWAGNVEAARSLLVIVSSPPSNSRYAEFHDYVNYYNEQPPFGFPNPFNLPKKVGALPTYAVVSLQRPGLGSRHFAVPTNISPSSKNLQPHALLTRTKLSKKPPISHKIHQDSFLFCEGGIRQQTRGFPGNLGGLASWYISPLLSRFPTEMDNYFCADDRILLLVTN